jgi:hypothetical protein
MTHNKKAQSNSTEDSILQERIRQARWGFNLSVAFVSLSATATLAGIILLLSGHISQGSYATLGGLTSTAVGSRCMQLSREANDRLDRITHTPNKDNAK